LTFEKERISTKDIVFYGHKTPKEYLGVSPRETSKAQRGNVP